MQQRIIKAAATNKSQELPFRMNYYIAGRYTTAGWRRWDTAIFRTTPIHSQICNKAGLLSYINMK